MSRDKVEIYKKTSRSIVLILCHDEKGDPLSTSPALFLAHVYHDVHLNKLREIYSQRWHIIHEGIAEHLPMFSRGHATGGTSFRLTGSDGFDAAEFARRLQKRGVLIELGHIFFYDGSPTNSFRMGFPNITTEKITSGLKQVRQEMDLL